MEISNISVESAVRERYPDYFASHANGSVFYNPWDDEPLRGFRDIFKWKFGDPNPWNDTKNQETPVSADPAGLDAFADSAAPLKSVWLGHASFLIELDGWRCLVDPVYGRVGAFVPRFGPEPYPIEALPSVDAVFLSHGHYDHLDVETLSAVAACNPNAQFVAPLGQGRYIPKAAGDVIELDWWQTIDLGGVQADFVPAQHWHRRGAFDTNRALWGGWVFRGSKTAYHAGDSGYCDVFKALGEMYEIDLACIPVGAYEPRWFMKTQHMDPEEAIQVFEDLRANAAVAMHWGTYDLTDEPRNLGGQRATELAAEGGIADRFHVVSPGGFAAG